MVKILLVLKNCLCVDRKVAPKTKHFSQFGCTHSGESLRVGSKNYKVWRANRAFMTIVFGSCFHQFEVIFLKNKRALQKTLISIVFYHLASSRFRFQRKQLSLTLKVLSKHFVLSKSLKSLSLRTPGFGKSFSIVVITLNNFDKCAVVKDRSNLNLSFSEDFLLTVSTIQLVNSTNRRLTGTHLL